MPAHRLQGRLEFQGLPISIENRKGSVRHWTDNNGETGTTKMKHPYGYVKGTLGLDGDAVDVFIGPDKDSDKVFVITQMSEKYDFKKIDEQKVMLGFSSKEEAKAAYLHHYTTPKFFGSIKEISVDNFREKLKTCRGKLIKALNEVNMSAKITDGDLPEKEDEELEKKFKSEAQRKYMYAASDRGEIPKDVVEEFSDKTPKGSKLPKKVGASKKVSKSQEAIDLLKSMLVKNYGPSTPAPVEKALTASQALGMAKEARAAAAYKSGSGMPQPEVGTNRVRPPQEPPVVPVRRIDTPSQFLGNPDVLKSCTSCGYIYKSVTEADASCPRCEHLTHTSESTDFWRR